MLDFLCGDGELAWVPEMDYLCELHDDQYYELLCGQINHYWITFEFLCELRKYFASWNFEYC